MQVVAGRLVTTLRLQIVASDLHQSTTGGFQFIGLAIATCDLVQQCKLQLEDLLGLQQLLSRDQVSAMGLLKLQRRAKDGDK